MSNISVQLKQGDVLSKKYEVDAPLGAGPEGATYAARDLDKGRKVVVKLLAGPPETRERAEALRKRADAIGHDGVVRMLDTGEYPEARQAAGAHRWVAMEYVEGESLRRVLDSYAGAGKQFSLAEACQVIVKILEVVDAAHQKGLVHRHLKPSNIIVLTRQLAAGRVARTVRITGFGVSDMINPRDLQIGLAENPAHAAYGAPEQISPSQSSAPSLDIYSIGVMFYEMLVGRTPRGTYLPPSDVHPELKGEVGRTVDDIVELSMDRDRENRYLTARDMLNHVQRALNSVDAGSDEGLSTKTVTTVVVGTVAALAVVGAVIAYTSTRDSRADDELRAELAASAVQLSDADLAAKRAGRDDMVYIPAGEYLKGRLNVETEFGSEPLAERTKVGAFFIDGWEWPNVPGDKSMVGVTWDEADALCRTKSKRLCTEDEWERACKGPQNFVYTYADVFNAETCGSEPNADRAPKDGVADVAAGALAGCKSAWGAFDMSGGVREWTASKRLKGGKPNNTVRGSRCSYAEERRADIGDRDLGFRCCLGEGEVIAATGAPAPASEPAGAGAPTKP